VPFSTKHRSEQLKLFNIAFALLTILTTGTENGFLSFKTFFSMKQAFNPLHKQNIARA